MLGGKHLSFFWWDVVSSRQGADRSGHEEESSVLWCVRVCVCLSVSRQGADRSGHEEESVLCVRVCVCVCKDKGERAE